MSIRLAPAAIICTSMLAAGCAASVTAVRQPLDRQRYYDNGDLVLQVISFDRRKEAPDHMGTGVVVDRSGYVLTNFHVVDVRPMPGEDFQAAGKYAVCVVPAGIRDCWSAKLVAVSPNHDLALLKTEKKTFKGEVRFVDDMEIEKGQEVYAFGNIGALAPPSPLFGRLLNWLTAAYLGVKTIELVSGRPIELPLLMFALPMNPGSSGGPIFLSEDGRCVALVFASVKTSDLSDPIGLAIPSSAIMPFLKEHLPSKPRK